MKRHALLSAVVLVWCASCAYGQTGTAPVLVAKPDAPYPEDARKAHLSGEVVVGFSIDAAGKTVRVHGISGPPVLSAALQGEIRRWRFVAPLPRDAEKDFVADYTYSIVEPAEVAEGTGQPQPADPDVVPGPIAAVSGVVHSVNNRQYIDATPSVRTEEPAPAP